MGGIWLCDRQGNGCFKRGEFGAAVTHYTAALALTPTAAGLWLNRAVANLKLQRCVRFLGVFDPFASVPRIDGWIVCRWAEAESDASVVLDLDARNAKAMYRRGVARRQLGKHDEAIQGTLDRLRAERCF
jgi:RNA polymerase II-associated protein 3